MKFFIVFMMFLFSLSLADDISLDKEILQMKQAPAEKRFELMNRIKKRIAAMNGAARAEAISKLVRTQKHQEGTLSPDIRPPKIDHPQSRLPNPQNPGTMIEQQIGKKQRPGLRPQGR